MNGSSLWFQVSSLFPHPPVSFGYHYYNRYSFLSSSSPMIWHFPHQIYFFFLFSIFSISPSSSLIYLDITYYQGVMILGAVEPSTPHVGFLNNAKCFDKKGNMLFEQLYGMLVSLLESIVFILLDLPSICCCCCC